MSEIYFDYQDLEKWSDGLNREMLELVYESTCAFAKRHNISDYLINLSRLTEPFDEKAGQRDPDMQHANAFFGGLLVGMRVGKSLAEDEDQLIDIEDSVSLYGVSTRVTDEEIAANPEMVRNYVDGIFGYAERLYDNTPALDLFADSHLLGLIDEDFGRQDHARAGIAIGYDMIRAYQEHYLEKSLREYVEKFEDAYGTFDYNWDAGLDRLRNFVDLELE